MRFLTLFVCFSCFSHLAFGQQIHRLAGYVQMPDEPLISYYVQFLVKGKEVSGFTVTDYKEGNRLKAKLVGRYVTPSDLWISEQKPEGEQQQRGLTYCFFHAKLKLSVANGRERWTGNFESIQENGIPCGSGYMTIIDDAPPLDFPAAKKIQVKAPEPPKARPIPRDTIAKAPAPPPPPKDTVRPPPPPAKKLEIAHVIHLGETKAKPLAPVLPDSNGCARIYNWASDSLVFELWDGFTIDGDVVSLVFNDADILGQTKLNKEKLHFTLPLQKGDNSLLIYFHAEGFEPPNTPNITLFDGVTAYPLNLSGKTGEKLKICIEKKGK